MSSRRFRRLPDDYIGIDPISTCIPILKSGALVFSVYVFLYIQHSSEESFLDWFFENVATFTTITYLAVGYVTIRNTLRLIEVFFRGYKWDDIGLHSKSGLLVRTVETIPKDRIQRVSKSQGAIQRLLEFGDLTVYTAGSSLNSVTIRDLRQSEMTRLNDEILNFLVERE